MAWQHERNVRNHGMMKYQVCGDPNRIAENIYAKGKNVETTILVCSLTALNKDVLVGLLQCQ
jgi:hypothetical protein